VLAPAQRAPHAEPTANNPLALRFYSKSLGRDRPRKRRPGQPDSFAAVTDITKLTGPFGQRRTPMAVVVVRTRPRRRPARRQPECR